MHTYYINVLLIIVSSTRFEHPGVRHQEYLYMPFYGISFMHPLKQSGRWQDVFGTNQVLTFRHRASCILG